MVIKEKEAMNLKRSKEGEFEGRKRKIGCNYIIISKIREIIYTNKKNLYYHLCNLYKFPLSKY